MNTGMNIGSLTTGTASEILSAAIIYAGITEVEKGNDTAGIILVIVGAAMFLIGFAILTLRGKVKRKEKEAEKLRICLDVANIMENLPADKVNEVKPYLKDILLGLGIPIGEEDD